ncbi:hypothetical protein [Nonomuraea maheshkhaliensis]|uniref:hypothetical protein n=1 Tax=Nonomuraea maheshkhaliensis TaxID=419590 RepID=UPI0031F8C950
MVTATLLTADDFPGELGDSYSSACAQLGLEANKDGYGIILCQDEDGARWTEFTTDVRGVDSVNSVLEMGYVAAGYEPDPATVVSLRPGWPLTCAVGYAELPEPHDPRGVQAADLLHAPEPDWIPAGRRCLADQIVNELRSGGHLSEEQYVDNYQFDAYNMGDHNPNPPARFIDVRRLVAADHPARPHLDAALVQAWSLARRDDLAPGSIRLWKTWPREKYVVRANGSSWTLIALVGGPAVLLLDHVADVPLALDEVPDLPALLDALMAAAGRSPI